MANVEEMMREYGERRKEHYRSACQRMKILNKRDTRYLFDKLKWAMDREAEERVNVSVIDIDQIITALELAKRDIIEAEKCNAAIEALRDVE